MISGDTTIARVLEAHPHMVDVLARYHPHFAHLRNRLLRRVMAPRVTVAQAARIAGVDAADLLAVLRREAGEGGDAGDAARPAGAATTRPREARPARLAALAESRLVHLDVREDIRQGREPFARIMQAVKALAEGEVLVLRTPFEPIPLYDVLGKRGLAHWTEARADDDWSVWFYRQAVVIDVRGLEPPEPMRLVLERLETLAPGQRLEVVHDRRPMLLYPQLEHRGFSHRTDEEPAGVVRIAIWRDAAAR